MMNIIQIIFVKQKTKTKKETKNNIFYKQKKKKKTRPDLHQRQTGVERRHRPHHGQYIFDLVMGHVALIGVWVDHGHEPLQGHATLQQN